MTFTLDRSDNQNNNSIMNFGGVEYKNQQRRSNQNKVGGNFINLPQRKHKPNYCKPISRDNKTGGGVDCGALGNAKRQCCKGPLPQYS